MPGITIVKYYSAGQESAFKLHGSKIPILIPLSPVQSHSTELSRFLLPKVQESSFLTWKILNQSDFLASSMHFFSLGLLPVTHCLHLLTDFLIKSKKLKRNPKYI